MEQAIILAAGRGRRLMPLSNDTPKCLVEVNGTPIIFNALDILAKHNFKKVVIVVGYLAEKVKKAIGNNWKGLEIVYVDNKKYNQTNNIYSLWLAREYLSQDTALMECDIFFEERLFSKCLTAKTRNTIIVSKFAAGMDGTVIQIDKNKKVTSMILGQDQGENFDFSDKYKTVNIYFFTKSFLQKHFVPNLDLYIKTQNLSRYYELILSVLIYLKHIPLHAEIVDDAKWIEIDDFSDLRKAEYLFSDHKQKFATVKSKYGGYWRYDFVDFSYLDNPYFPTQEFFGEFEANLRKLIKNYPSGQNDLELMLSNWTGIESRYLALSNGASELIRIINKNFVKKITIPLPTFNEYESNLRPEQINYFMPNYSGFKLDVKGFIKSVKDSKSNVALLINPGNPTSQVVDIEGIKTILNELKHLDLFILDESFIDFCSGEKNASMVELFRDFNNLIIIKSMGKSSGVLGLRLGYAISVNEFIMAFIRKNMPIWNVNSVAEYFLEAFPKYRNEYADSCSKVLKDARYLYKKLSLLKGIKPFYPYANFVLAELTGKIKSNELQEILFLKSNSLIKDCSNKKGLSDKYIRIAARPKKETDMLIKYIKICLNGKR